MQTTILILILSIVLTAIILTLPKVVVLNAMLLILAVISFLPLFLLRNIK